MNIITRKELIKINEFDLLLKSLENIISENIKCEDNQLYLPRKVKYDLFNLLYEIDKSFMDKLLKKLEYKEDK